MKYISKLLPVWGNACRIIDTFPDSRYPYIYLTEINTPFESYHILGVINWEDETRDFEISLKKITRNKNKEFQVFSFFDEKFLGSFKSRIDIKNVPAHGCKLLAIKEKGNHPQLLSTNMHLSQGAVELENYGWSKKEDTLSITVKHFEQEDAKLFIGMPEKWHIHKIKSDAEKYSIDDFDNNCIVIRFKGKKKTRFKIRCDKNA